MIDVSDDSYQRKKDWKIDKDDFDKYFSFWTLDDITDKTLFNYSSFVTFKSNNSIVYYAYDY